MKKRVVIVVLFILAGLASVMAQPPVYSGSPASPARDTTPKRMFISTTMGTSFFKGAGYSGFSTFVMPSISYRLTPKLTIQTGLGYNSMRMPQFGEMQPFAQNAFVLNARALYQVNENVVVYGSVHKSFPESSAPAMNPMAMGMNRQSSSVGVIFKVSENVHMGFQISQSRGPGYFNPMGPSMYNYGSPYGSSMMGSPW